MALTALAQDTQSTRHAPSRRPVDLVFLANQCLGDQNLEREILRLLNTTLSTYFQRLLLATAFDDLLLNIHSIRGAAAGVGAWPVTEMAKAMETELRAGRPLSTESIADLGLEIDEVLAFVEGLLSSQSA